MPIKFILNLELLNEVVKEESKFTHGSVGIFNIVLRKKESPKYWKNLVQEGSESPAYMKYWFEMREKFIDELQPFIDDQEREVKNNILVN